MYFNKYPYRSNFEYPQNINLKKTDSGEISADFKVVDFQPDNDEPMQEMSVQMHCTQHEGDVYHLQFSSKKWPKNYSQSDLNLPKQINTQEGSTELELNDDFSFSLKDEQGQLLLKSVENHAFGVSGKSSIFQFERNPGDQFYGMGEKMLGLELSNVSTKFWNVDVWADNDPMVFTNGRPDPMYVSVPYIIIKRENSYIGILIDNPFATYIMTNGKVNVAGQMDATAKSHEAIMMGAEHGQPNLIIINGPSLAELTQKLQKIVGVTPMPPAWALGYQQCRWGYESFADLQYLNASMDRFDIPCDGLWLDIEYMRGYRVFTFEEEKNFPDLKNNIAEVQKSGRRVVPIIDPGVKKEEGYDICESGLKEDIYCKNPQGQDFTGLVWPGETLFPDYSTEKGRKWWADHVESFAKDYGITGAWLDMNDPATGDACCVDMLFNGGKDSHYTYHNQYGMGMSRASRDGFQAAYPEDRPFLLSRSGFTGSSKYAAIWTGDNVSNYHYLKGSIACSLNLALSGIPFNGPDAGGFGGDTTAQIMKDWFKAGFLFPFFRNHSIKGSEHQEPWVFDSETREVLIHYIRMRYKLRPYLYNLFVQQEASGEAILRPLFYDFADSAELPLSTIDDQFMVGPYIMQAPFVEEDQEIRKVVLPDAQWYCLAEAQWCEGAEEVTVIKDDKTSPIYIREGAILPMSTVADGDHTFVSNDVEFHLFNKVDSELKAEYTYTFDDGQTYAYKKGERSQVKVSSYAEGKTLFIETELLADGYGDIAASFVLYDQFEKIYLNGEVLSTAKHDFTFAGKNLELLKT
ncbi:hypothetical protein LNTAR_19612 [Lentisphaera araneosa HTCC2155]|uniref:Uncharacterized protein n=1 Tax=Lentisphaera araneosa HTCC2155 TaxID=313628 RepID=A6DQY8_9BACT|nr:glycoside hydrolase family 31 protein [Lentisphaera araneosa]EDM26038.1 hypothetical protein LNTAR_19612 [Lentisphaera araneosa HTCC2155]